MLNALTHFLLKTNFPFNRGTDIKICEIALDSISYRSSTKLVPPVLHEQ